MSHSSSDAPQLAVVRQAGFLGRVWGAVTGRTLPRESSQVQAVWGIDPAGAQTRDPAERVTLPAAAPAPITVPAAVPERSQADRIYLTVPFAERNQVKALGARWDADRKAWWTKAGYDNRLLKRWLDGPSKDAPAPPVVQDAALPASASRGDYKAHFAALRAEGVNPVANGWTRDEALAMASYLDEKTGLTMARGEPSDADYARAEAMADPTHPMHDEQREAEADAYKEPPIADRGSASRDERTLLAVPFAQKDEAKQAGARWDATARAWFIPPGVDRTPFEAWLPGNAQQADPVAQFADALRQAGLQVERPEMDGKLHRVPVEGDRGRDRSGAYKGHLDGWPAGFFENFKTGERMNWKASGQARPVSVQEREAAGIAFVQKLRERAEERERLHERTADQVGAMWAAATPASTHPYLEAKGVEPHGLRQGAPGQAVTVDDREGKPREVSVAGQLFVPVRDAAGDLASLQFIRRDGSKMFMPDGRVDGGHFVIGDVRQPGPLLIAEGFSTAATIHELTGHTAIVAFNAGNIGKVAEVYRERFPDRAIVIAGDNDHRREAEGKPNVGREKAAEAAAAIDGHALIPSFSPGADGSDWNDVARIEGREAAQLALLAGVRVAERERMVASMGAARLSEREPSRSHERATSRSGVHYGNELER